jgi:hypothetical protein
MQGPLSEEFIRMSTRSSHKDLRKITQGPPRGIYHDLHSRFSNRLVQDYARTKTGTTVLRKPGQPKCTWTSQRDDLCENLPAKRRRPKPGQPFCASLRSQNAHVTRANLCEDLQEKSPRTGPPFCASLRNRNAHVHLTRLILCENMPGKSQGPRTGPRFVRATGPRFVRACGVEMHMGMSQEQSHAKI